jgi:deoxyribonuclease V
MDIPHLHDWDMTPKAAVALQRELAGRVRADMPLKTYRYIAGADVSYNRFSPVLYAGIVVLRAEDLTVVERRGLEAKTTFPYVPGLLSFREIPVVLELFRQLEHEPDVVMCDGQGYAHPRRFGLACHLGLWLDRPTFGCAKSLFVGEFGRLKRAAGAQSPLVHKEEIIGTALRTKTGIKPVYVSVGHRIDLPSAVRIALASVNGYRIPEPTRQAHLFVNELRRTSAARDCGILG